MSCARHLESLRLDLSRQGSRTTQVLVGRVRARSNESHLHPLWIAIGLYLGSKLRDRAGSVGRERAVQVGFQRIEVYLNDSVVEVFRVCGHFRIGT